MASTHEAVFIWPSTSPSRVILRGSFDNWSSSIPLSKDANGFTGKVSVPYGQKVLYKFIVDGSWATVNDLPTELDSVGNLNNVYHAPAQPTPINIASHILAAASRRFEEVETSIDASVAKTPTLETTQGDDATVNAADPDMLTPDSSENTALTHEVEESTTAPPAIEGTAELEAAQEILSETAPPDPVASATSGAPNASTHEPDVSETIPTTTSADNDISSAVSAPTSEDVSASAVVTLTDVVAPASTAVDSPIPVSRPSEDGVTADPAAVTTGPVTEDIKSAVADLKPSEIIFPSNSPKKNTANGINGSHPRSRSPSGKYDAITPPQTPHKKRASVFGSIRRLSSVEKVSHEEVKESGHHKHESQHRERKACLFARIKNAISSPKKRTASAAGPGITA